MKAHSSRAKKRRCLDIELNIERAKTSMDARASEVVIGLLARWAVRRASEMCKVTEGPTHNGVTGYVSKG